MFWQIYLKVVPYLFVAMTIILFIVGVKQIKRQLKEGDADE